MLLNKRISILYFIRLIRYDIVIIVIYAVLMGFLDKYSIFSNLVIPISVSAIIGTLISLLLAFKTAQSYERWWEARIIWGAIVNDSRSIVRQLKQFLPAGEQSDKLIKIFALRQIIWCYSLADSLRKKTFRKKVNDYLAEHNIESANVPNYLLNEHAKQIAAIADQFALNANMQIQLDATLVRLNDAMGKCERIKNTVFPKSYSILIHFLIYVFLTIFPFGLDDAFIFTEMLLTILIPVLFVAIEQTAIILQDPFENKPTDTPMTTLSQTIEKNLCEITGMPYVAEEENKAAYYVM